MRRRTRRPAPRPSATPPSRGAPLDLVNSAAGTASFLGSLLLYAGYIYINAYFGYFHLDSFAIGFSTFELIMRSLRLATLPTFEVMAVILLMPGLLRLLALLPVRGRYLRGLRQTVRAVARAYLAVAASGVVLMLLWRWIQPHAWVAPSLVAVGLLLGRTPAATPARASSGPAWERAGALVMAGLFLIWAVALVAGQLGRQDASSDAGQLVRRVAVVVVSTDRLSMVSPGLVYEDLGPGTHYRYRYSGLRLLIERDHRYYLVSLGWRRITDPTFIIEDDDSVRVELRAGTQPSG
ncbi:hypothetical protein [Streptomyces kaempferi]|uniref:Uncharacterized protein n=1 Tax=Streptomyces kaempferi TaxID=333725 RepID=A0ABW3XS52_9ACTN